jgi:polyferredoxin/Pyruvate/2-oxoacid:ferredoxin oxidoreductase delta subunit
MSESRLGRSRRGSGCGGRRARPTLRELRRASQLAFFAGFVLFFGFAARLVKTAVPPDLFLRADPLIALSGAISLRRVVLPHLWYALPVVVLSLALGRAFCGWVCPMGTCIDICERLFRIRGRRPAQAPPWRRLKFYLLLGLLLTLLLPAAHRSARDLALSQTVGLSAVYLLDPMALLTRTFTLTGLPAAQWAATFTGDTLTVWSYSDFVSRHELLARALSPIQFGLSQVTRPVQFRLALFTLAFFGVLIALGRVARRFWCRNLCPLGALLGFLGKVSPIRLRVSESCTRCMRCVNECKVGAITEDPYRYRGAECIACYSCIAVCPEGAISVGGGAGRQSALTGKGRDDALQLDRRRVLQAVGAGLAAVVVPKIEWGVKRSEGGVLKISGSKLIRPPGALPEDSFVTACVRCGECMKVCPTSGLQPALGEGGLEALETPILVPRIGYCAQICNLCGQVCPTRAIEPFTIEEKEHLYLGTAVIDRSMCVAWAGDRQCLVCDEQCSYDAISQKQVEGLPRPVVDENVCVGCGVCERVCPVQPQAAIHVYASGDKRHWPRAKQRAWRERARRGRQEGTTSLPYPGL